MRLTLTEDPKEWRKAAWFASLGLALMSSLLRWRGVLPRPAWLAALVALAGVAVAAWFRPGAFRGWHHFSKRLSYYLIEILGRAVLALFFFFFLTPLALVLRLLGKDPLQLKPSQKSTTLWIESKASTPLDRLF